MKVHLYRGISNTYEAEHILVNKTVGGQIIFNANNTLVRLKNNANIQSGMTRYADLVEQSTEEYMGEVRENPNEGIPSVFTLNNLRPLIEYSFSENIASGFGMLGLVKVEIDTQYISNVRRVRNRNEESVFCVANAPVISLYFTISRFNVNVDRKTDFINRLNREHNITFPYRYKFDDH